MPKPNNSHTVSAGSGQTLAAHLVSSKKYPVVVRADAFGNLIDDPTNVFAAGLQMSPVGGTNLGSFSVFNNDAAAIVEILFASVTQPTGGSVGYSTCALRKITAHSNGTSITPVKLDTSSSNLDADITVRQYNDFTPFAQPTTADCYTQIQSDINGGNCLHPGKKVLWSTKENPPIILRQGQGAQIEVFTTYNPAQTYLNTLVFRVR